MLEIKYTFDKLKWAHPIKKRFVGNVTASLRLGPPKLGVLENNHTLDKLK
jgi:hypothetical protein